MKRRKFITLLGGAAAAWPFAALAQQGTQERMRRIAVLVGYADNDPEGQRNVSALVERLAELGWRQGHNASIDVRFAAGDAARIGAYTTELLALAPDVIVCHSYRVLSALRTATRTVPIVVAQASDPVDTGLVASTPRPGGNITGFFTFEHSVGGKWLELLKEAAPRLERVLVMAHPGNASAVAHLKSIIDAAPSLGVEAQPGGVGDVADFEAVIAAFAREANAGIIVPPDPFNMTHRDAIIASAARHRLPAVYPYRAYVVAGGLMSYGTNLSQRYRQAASYVDRILKGANPAELPAQAPAKFEFAINLKTAATLGLSVPPTVIALADEVIE
jgi:putative tryptophan/tyrosine transport system substrate-binding protein